MAENLYLVEAQFSKHRFFYASEFWEGKARNMSVACRKAIKDILRRKNVKRLRHKQVVFRVEKLG